MCERFKTSRGVETWAIAEALLRETVSKTKTEQDQDDAPCARDVPGILLISVIVSTICFSAGQHFVDFLKGNL